MQIDSKRKNISTQKCLVYHAHTRTLNYVPIIFVINICLFVVAGHIVNTITSD